MHVGVFSYYYLPVVNGVTLTIADWKKWAQKDGIRFTICIPQLNDSIVATPDVFEYPAIRLYRKFGITVPLFPQKVVEQELANRNVDILHVHHPFYIGKLALAAKRVLGIPLVFTYHTRYSDYMMSYFPLVSKKFAKSIVTSFMVRFMNKCDAVTVSNDSLKHELLKQGVRVPIFLVPPGIDTAKYSTGDRDVTRTRLGISPDDTVLLYVGRLAKEKNIYFLLNALFRIHKNNPHVKLLCAGNGLEEKRIRAYAKRKKLESRIVLADHENPDSIAHIYAAADIFVYASQTETFGRVIVEAMSAKLPVVALSGPSIIDILKDGITGRIVFKKSIREFTKVVLEVIKNNKTMKSLGLQGQREAIKQYDSIVSWKKLRNVYETVLEKR